MAKQQSFADKAAKAAREKGAKCQKCDTLLQHVILVESGKSVKTSANKFTQRRVSVCKCNEKEIYG